jgi:hypothetical protein
VEASEGHPVGSKKAKAVVVAVAQLEWVQSAVDKYLIEVTSTGQGLHGGEE